MTIAESSDAAHVGVEMYRRMRMIRRFEERVVELVNANEIPGVTHEYIGEEAIAVGVCAALRPDDAITSTHRGHGHILAKGGEPRFMFAELMGRVTGYNKGRGGSMHIADVSLGILGANGIVAAGVPMACGAAYTFKRRSTEQIAVGFFGEGAFNQGVLHESLNLASVWRLPVLFVCENNQYAVTTPVDAVSLQPLWKRALSYGMHSEHVDGMNVGEVLAAAQRACERVRGGEGPVFLEFETYRYVGHQTAERFMKLGYRTEEEIRHWRERDPVEFWSKHLVDRAIWTDEDRRSVDAELERELDAGIDFARSSAWPDAGTYLDYAYAKEYPNLPAKGWE